MNFSSAHPALGRALATRGYETPTAVQLAVLEADKASRDLLVSAQTGSGKTVAFGLAIAPTLLGEGETLPPAGAPMALIIAPTRELAMQVQRELDWLYKDAGAKVVTCVGGMDVRTEARQLNFGAHIVVGTPGRLRDHLERGRLDLSKLSAVVLDEADEMLDLGFREDLEYILDDTPAERQTLLFSATMPREIETLAGQYQRDAVRIQTVNKNEQHADIEYQAMRVAPHDVEHAVVNVLRFHEARAAIVFCATRESVKRLHARLNERGFSAVALSGELTQGERTNALQSLRAGHARVLVATDVAARGLDLPDLALVIHAELPNDAETLLHRSGRTGRAGNKGLCAIIVPFNRRRKAEGLLGAAKLKVTWTPAPTADEIRARDQQRFLGASMFTDPATEDDTKLAQELQQQHSAEEIAMALVRYHRAQLPAPEDLAEDTGPPPRRTDRDRAPRGEWQRRDGNSDGFRRERPEGAGERRSPRPVHDDGRPMTWFRINIGRERNADPRWLLPLLCRAGGVTKAEIGAIRIFDRDTRFQIVSDAADRFSETAQTLPSNEGRISLANDGAPAGAGAGEAKPERARPHRKWDRDDKREPRERRSDARADRPQAHHDAGAAEQHADRDAHTHREGEPAEAKAPAQDAVQTERHSERSSDRPARRDGGKERSDRDRGPRPDWKKRDGNTGGHRADRRDGGKPSRHEGDRGPRPDWKKRDGDAGGHRADRRDGGKPSRHEGDRGPRPDWKKRDGDAGGHRADRRDGETGRQDGERPHREGAKPRTNWSDKKGAKAGGARGGQQPLRRGGSKPPAKGGKRFGDDAKSGGRSGKPFKAGDKPAGPKPRSGRILYDA
ncbi:DEAD/DEAH box helicase [Hyphomicrobium sulfonivorans]|nr:DEAD/DEAH box helicase [Hyphomicrobium sulfonivorans]NSL70298.1 DEAD/DEAH box helicase [Hyphomicrobium sulfonivorans]